LGKALGAARETVATLCDGVGLAFSKKILLTFKDVNFFWGIGARGVDCTAVVVVDVGTGDAAPSRDVASETAVSALSSIT
jgi:hypothetical protein